MKKIYICHQYMEKSHFKALYDCASYYGYKIADFIVLNRQSIWNDFVRIWKDKKYSRAIKEVIMAESKIIKFRMLKNEVLIVGVAPYDPLMNSFSGVFKKNKCIYFTSWQYWNSNNCPRGHISNKTRFENELRQDFMGIACVSNKTAQEVQKFELPIEVVNHAIDSESYIRKKEFVRTYRYIFLGRFEKVKNIPVILKYFYKHRDKDITIDFVGDGALKQEIIKATNRDRRIHYLGKWSKTDIKNKLSSYDFLILPSLKEPFGIVLLEALTSGVPCIVSDAIGPAEIIQNDYNGFVFELTRKDGFESAMDQSLSISEARYSEMCLNAIKDSDKYSSREIIKKWMALFEKAGI